MRPHKTINEEAPFLECHDTDHEDLVASVKRKTQVVPWIIHCIIFVAYTCAYVIAIGRASGRTGTALQEIDHIIIQHEPKAYDDFELSPFAGVPSPTVDAAWHDLLEHTTIRVTAEELRRSNQTSVELPEGGGYMAWLGVYHELHCLKMVRQWIYRDHYHPDLTSDGIEEWSIHADHCLDILRSAAMCHADTTLTTFGWANKSKPMLNTRPIDHKCVDWEAMTKSVSDRQVGKEEMAALVNPLLHESM